MVNMKKILLLFLIVGTVSAGWLNVDSLNVKQKFRFKNKGTDQLLYIEADDSLGYSANIYDINDSIGIGTATPGALLHIAGGTNIDDTLIVDVGAGIATTPGSIDPTQITPGGRTFLSVSDADNWSSLTLATDRVVGNGDLLSMIMFGATNETAGHGIKANIRVYNDGSTAGEEGGLIDFQTKADAGNLLSRMVIDEGGYVGIGTSDPGYLLEVYNAAPLIAAKSSVSGTPTAFMYADANGGAIGTITNHNFTFYTNNVTRMILNTSGVLRTNGNEINYDGTDGEGLYFNTSNDGIFTEEVGIGIDPPNTDLHIYGIPNTAGDIVAHLLINDETTSAEGVGGGIAFSCRDDATDNRYIAGIKAYKANSTGTDYSGQLHFQTRKTGGSGETQMIIDEDGNVGINELSPGSIDPSQIGSTGRTFLSVSDEDNWSSLTLATDRAVGGGDLLSMIMMGATGETSGHGIKANIRCYNDGTTAGEEGGLIDFQTKADAGNIASRMVIDEKGDIGIGTNDPDAKLTIAEGPDTIKIDAIQWGCIAYTSGTFAGGVSDPDMASVGGTSLYQPHFAGLASLEEVHGTMKVPDDALPNDTLFFATRTAPATTGAGNYTFHFYYSIINNSGTTTITSVDDSLIATTAASGTAYEFTTVELGYITGLVPNDCILFRFFRDPADATDTYGADVACIGAGFKYRIRSLGQLTK